MKPLKPVLMANRDLRTRPQQIDPMDNQADRRGLIRLMLKMPVLRGRLQIVCATKPNVFSLCGAYEEASAMLDRLRKDGAKASPDVVAEYEELCTELENDIIRMCQ